MSGVTELSSVPHKQPRFWALVTLFLAPAFIFANMYTTQAILPVFSRDFHVSAPTAGLTVSVLVLAVAIGSLFSGALFDRLGGQNVMGGGRLLVLIPRLLSGVGPKFSSPVCPSALPRML